MNDKKIVFIACVNNEQEFSEALFYIERLHVPEGYVVDTVVVNEAPSMTAGYNAAMQSSDAKYKVYMHQDTFIMHQDFIVDMLGLFQSDEKIGMFGCIGCRELSPDAQAVVSWDTGKIYHNCNPRKMEGSQREDGTPVPVEALDGLLLATQYDVEWREDLFDGWDFYDVSQCLEMKRAGYKVVVPYQQEPWCYHDNSYSKMGKYQEYCSRLAEEYQDIKPFFAPGCSENRREYDLLREQSRSEFENIVEAGTKDAFEEIFEKQGNQGYLHLRDFEVLANIDRLERAAGVEFFWKSGETWKELRRKIAEVKFLLKRMEYGADENGESLNGLMEKYSIWAIDVVHHFYCVDKERVWQLVVTAINKSKNMP